MSGVLDNHESSSLGSGSGASSQDNDGSHSGNSGESDTISGGKQKGDIIMTVNSVPSRKLLVYYTICPDILDMQHKSGICV